MSQIIGSIVGSFEVEERPDQWLASDGVPRLSPAGSEPSDGVVELDTSCLPIHTTRRSATSRSAPTRKLSASRRPRQHDRHRKHVRYRFTACEEMVSFNCPSAFWRSQVPASRWPCGLPPSGMGKDSYQLARTRHPACGAEQAERGPRGSGTLLTCPSRIGYRSVAGRRIDASSIRISSPTRPPD
jgi:hypothetical protein